MSKTFSNIQCDEREREGVDAGLIKKNLNKNFNFS